MKAFKIVAACVGTLLILTLPLFIAIGAALTEPDGPVWLLVVASLCWLTSITPVIVGAISALSVGDPDSPPGRRLVKRLLLTEIAVVSTGIVAITAAALFVSSIALIAAGFVVVSIVLAIAGPLIGLRIWRYEAAQPILEPADDITGPIAEARRKRALVIWFAAGVMIGAALLLTLALQFQNGQLSRVPDIRQLVTYVSYPLVVGCFGACFVSIRATLAFGRLASRIAGQDVASNKRFRRALVSGRDTLVDADERNRASHLAQIAVVSLP